MKQKLLFIIVFAQFAGTSLWFVTNAIADKMFEGNASAADITSIVQFGFIAGTLVFALLNIADRFSSSLVFFISTIIAAGANLLLLWSANEISWILVLRFLTGFFLAGIYPVGMKIAAECFPGKIGNALGFLVGALVLGTAFPHLLRSALNDVNWKSLIIFTSVLAVTGGFLLLLFVPSTHRHHLIKVDIARGFKLFRIKDFRKAAFGYFGHMWELYSFWAFLPIIIGSFNLANNEDLNVPFWSFAVIAAGSFGCVAGGLISQKAGSIKVAYYSLMVSGACCLFSPLLFGFSTGVFLFILLIWGLTVVSDSPQFSTLVAKSVPPETKGTALTIVTSIGFAITIISIQILHSFIDKWKEAGYLILALGPIIGLASMSGNKGKKS